MRHPHAARASLLTLVACVLGAPSTTDATPGEVDSSFGINGVVFTDLGAGSDIAFDVVVQADGKIVAAGDASPYPTREFAVARYHADGSLDLDFGFDGYLTTDFGGGDNNGLAVALQTDGKIVVVGKASLGAGPIFGVVRYNTDGTRDLGFGTAGLVATSFATGTGAARAVGVQPDGKIVAAGGAGGELALARYETDGTLDPTFGAGGLVTTDLGGAGDRVRALVLQPDGKIVVGGRAGSSSVSDLALVRYDAVGALDPTFGTGGVVTADLDPGAEGANALALQPDGKLVVASRADGDPALLRYEADGTLDASFGAGGIAILASAAGPVSGTALALAPDGRIVVGGSATGASGSSAFAVSRYAVNGSVDTSFGTMGVTVIDPTADSDGFHALAFQADGTVVLAGDARPPGSKGDFAVARIEGGSSLDCAPAPLAGCRVPIAPGKAKLVLKDNARPERTKLIWKWTKGEATVSGDAGDPLAADDLVVCLYDTALLARLSAPAGGLCGGRPCWKATNKGFKYRDADGTPEGLDKLLVKAGVDGKAKATAVASGGTVAGVTASLPLALPVRVQLQASTGVCWEATYSASGARRNDASRFKGTSD